MEKAYGRHAEELLSRMVAYHSYLQPELIRAKGLLNIGRPFPPLIWEELFLSYGIDRLYSFRI